MFRVMVAEEDRNLRADICEHIEQREGDVVTAETPEELLEIAKQGHLDAIILDIAFARERNCYLIENMFSLPHKIPVITITSHTTRREAVRSLELGAAAYIIKPFEMNELMVRLKQLRFGTLKCDSTQAQNEMKCLNEELEKRVQERTAELQAANQELESFACSISHDLRAPLRAIQGFAAILLNDYGSELSDEGTRTARTIIRNADRMEQLIKGILAFSKLSRTQMQLRPVDMSLCLEEVLAQQRLLENGRAVKVVVNPLPTAHADVQLVRQVLSNLVENAFKFTRKTTHPRVEVGGHEVENEVIYYVKDNGAGFDMQYYSELFGVFKRLRSVSEFEGTGIGLANVKRIVERHGGRVWAESRHGQETTFFFTLPKGPYAPQPRSCR